MEAELIRIRSYTPYSWYRYYSYPLSRYPSYLDPLYARPFLDPLYARPYYLDSLYPRPSYLDLALFRPYSLYPYI